MDIYNAYFFKYSSGDGSCSIDMVNYNMPKLTGTVELWKGQVSAGYTIIEPFYQNKQLYLLMYQPGTITFYQITFGTSDFTVKQVWQEGYETGWTHLKPFYTGTSNDQVSIFQFKSVYEDPAVSRKTTQTVGMNQINDNASGISVGWRTQWKEYWKILEPFYQQPNPDWYPYPYILMNDPDTLNDKNVEIDFIVNPASETVRKWTSHWKTPWTIIKPFYMGMTPYLFEYGGARDSPPVSVDYIKPDVQGTKNLWRSTWGKGWTIIQAFYLNYPNMRGPLVYLITYRGYSSAYKNKYNDGAVTFNDIAASNQGQVDEIWRGTWPKTLTHIVPFNLLGQDYPFVGRPGT